MPASSVDAFCRAVEHAMKAGGRSKMMDQVQEAQPKYWEPTDEDDFWHLEECSEEDPCAECIEECSYECPKAYCRGMGWWDRAIKDIRDDYYITVGLPIPSVLWEKVRRNITYGWDKSPFWPDVLLQEEEPSS